MIRRSVSILNDLLTTADMVPSGFGTEYGRFFGLGPENLVSGSRGYR